MTPAKTALCEDAVARLIAAFDAAGVAYTCRAVIDCALWDPVNRERARLAAAGVSVSPRWLASRAADAIHAREYPPTT